MPITRIKTWLWPRRKLATIWCKCSEIRNTLNPARSPQCSSSLFSDKTPARRRLQWFQIHQAPKTIELSPFLTWWSSTLSFVLANQSSKGRSSGCVVRSCRLTFCNRLNHTWWAKTQDVSRWWIVSWAWSQRQQRLECGSPRCWLSNTYYFCMLIVP